MPLPVVFVAYLTIGMCPEKVMSLTLLFLDYLTALRQENQELRQEMKEMRQLLQLVLQRVK